MEYMYNVTIKRRLPETGAAHARPRNVRRKRRAGQRARVSLAFTALLALVIGLLSSMVTLKADVSAAETNFAPAPVAEAEPVETAVEPETIAAAETEMPYTVEDAEALAKAMWGEARGCGDTHMAAVGWCALNRVDSPAWADDLLEVLSQPNQFCGYDPEYPVEPHILEIACDVLDRYYFEKETGIRNPGRVLPENYYYFTGDGYLNYFRTEYADTGVYWDWSLPSPYAD